MHRGQFPWRFMNSNAGSLVKGKVESWASPANISCVRSGNEFVSKVVPSQSYTVPG